MANQKLKLQSKKIIVSGLISAKVKNLDDHFVEIQSYIESKHGVVLQFFVQRRGVSRSKKPDGSKTMHLPLSQAYGISHGKAKELKRLVLDEDCELILIIDGLDDRQIANLQALLQCEVISFETLGKSFPEIL